MTIAQLQPSWARQAYDGLHGVHSSDLCVLSHDPSFVHRSRQTWRFVIGIAALAMASVIAAVYLSEMHGGRSALIGLGDMSPSLDGTLVGDKRTMQSIEKEINDDMQVNNALRKGYSKEFQSAQGSDAANCHCDCQNSASEFKVKAATMLAQVGDSMFFGKCASCPCMRKTDVETEVNMLAGLLEAASAMGQNITSDIGAHIPVDIDIRVGPKGGAPSPVLPRDAATQPRHAPRVE